MFADDVNQQIDKITIWNDQSCRISSN